MSTQSYLPNLPFPYLSGSQPATASTSSYLPVQTQSLPLATNYSPFGNGISFGQSQTSPSAAMGGFDMNSIMMQMQAAFMDLFSSMGGASTSYDTTGYGSYLPSAYPPSTGYTSDPYSQMYGSYGQQQPYSGYGQQPYGGYNPYGQTGGYGQQPYNPYGQTGGGDPNIYSPSPYSIPGNYPSFPSLYPSQGGYSGMPPQGGYPSMPTDPWGTGGTGGYPSLPPQAPTGPQPPLPPQPPTGPTQPPAPPKPPPAPYDGKGSTWGDPHFVGADDEKYDVHGEAGKTYNLLTDKGIQYNAKFEKYNGAATVEGVQPTIISEAGITIGEGADAHKLFVSRNPEGDVRAELGLEEGSALENGKVYPATDGVHFYQWNAEANAFSSVPTIDGKPMEAGKEYVYGENKVKWDGEHVTVITSEYEITLDKVADANGNHLNHNYKVTNPFHDGVDPHGLWGASVDRDRVKQEAVEGHAAGQEVLEGAYTDYQTADLWDTTDEQFKYNRYGSAGSAAEAATAEEYHADGETSGSIWGGN